MYLTYLAQLEKKINETRILCKSANFTAANIHLQDIFKLLKRSSFYRTESSVYGAEEGFNAQLHATLLSYYGLINTVYMADAYQLMEDCNECILKGDLTKATLIHRVALKKLETLDQLYGNALQNGIHKTDAYIDMPREFSYLYRYLKQVEHNYTETIANRLFRTLNNYPMQVHINVESQISVGKNRHSQFGCVGGNRPAEAALKPAPEYSDEDISTAIDASQRSLFNIT
ncbi:hypothetical protein [Legionella drozanskii]|uniref:Uncharacterized protein n=1 Tax=Legionella drozanskii LLAP-1 TaxID=1212489 RepID=A0A0W0SR88_9GAMM|nr:hypothetical protein [Legionella drozanskii]KTC85927.1 hypothetical protein Ldro_2252 [Legionella drozanskii LLAP-1]